MGGRGGTLRLFVTMCRIASNALNWVFKELLLGVPSAIQQVTDAIKQRTFTREIIRRIVSRNGLYSKIGRITADSRSTQVITAS